MEYRALGQTGLQVSEIGLGGNVFGAPRLDRTSSTRNIHHASALGINFIDTAYLYNDGESETFIGAAIADRRDRFTIATKFHFFGMTEGETPEQRIRDHCETSLRRLGIDCIDLYQIHFPEPSIRPEVILGTLAELMDEGKVRFIGECNYASWRHREALAVAGRHGLPRMVTAQNQYSLVRRMVELEVLPFCEAYEIGFLPYFPLAGGFLSGKYRPGEPPPPGSRGAANSPTIRRARTEKREALLLALEAYAKTRGHTVLELAIAWLLACKPVSSVITGTMSCEQIDQNVAAAAWRLSDQEKAEVDAIAAWDGSDEGIEPSLESFK